MTGFLIQAKSSDARFIAELRQRIESTISGVAATPARDHVQGDTQIRLARAMAWTTAAVALFLGSVGMLNTMLMSIFERTREIGILQSGRLAAATGARTGAGRSPGDRLDRDRSRRRPRRRRSAGHHARTHGSRLHQPELAPEVLLIALAMGVGLSLLGGLYPAARAAALEPTEALRYE